MGTGTSSRVVSSTFERREELLDDNWRCWNRENCCRAVSPIPTAAIDIVVAARERGWWVKVPSSARTWAWSSHFFVVFTLHLAAGMRRRRPHEATGVVKYRQRAMAARVEESGGWWSNRRSVMMLLERLHAADARAGQPIMGRGGART